MKQGGGGPREGAGMEGIGSGGEGSRRCRRSSAALSLLQTLEPSLWQMVSQRRPRPQAQGGGADRTEERGGRPDLIQKRRRESGLGGERRMEGSWG
jgi:hypothetical protein